mmetsp:Transcript_31109/g.75185  ORF Transcript_31109/g.75185 Transcript_31109/m.75185 type:complete len:331 (-) Transcript_31109:235-1227(-)
MVTRTSSSPSSTMFSLQPLSVLLPLLLMATAATNMTVVAFSPSSSSSSSPSSSSFSVLPRPNNNNKSSKQFVPSGLFAVVSSKPGTKGYEPKWKKKTTLADEQGDKTSLGFDKVGLKGTIPVVFRTIKTDSDKKKKKKKNRQDKGGGETGTEQEQDAATAVAATVVEEKTSMAWAGQPIRDVASQAGQYIKYGCGKGECGTCECMVNGKWVRPCIDVIPAEAAASPGTDQQPLVVQVKAVKSKSKSSGTFFSIKSFIMGFWNNLLGMIGFVKFRRAAMKNWEERRAYENLVRVKTIEKRMQRLAREATGSNGKGNSGKGPSSASGGFAHA